MAPIKIKKRYFVILALVLVVLVLILADKTSTERTNISKPEQIIREILAPLQNGASAISDKMQSIPLYFGGIDKLEAEKQELQDQVAALQNQIVATQEETLENIRLKALLTMADSQRQTWNPVGTTVINRSQSTWYRTMIINGGEDQGFAVNMPVVAAEGLVGRIINVSNHTSEVLLILDKEGPVAAMIQDTRTVGVVEGVDDEAGTLSLIHIPYDSKIEKYQKIISSGLGGMYPKGLLIGYIKEIELEPGGLMLRAKVQSFVDFDKLEEVIVLKPKS